MVVNSVADISEVHVATLKIEAACTSETSAASSITMRCNIPGIE
jgi:hypothetical protein